MGGELVLFDVDGGGVAMITLNRQDRLNAINLEMRDLLWTYIEACHDIPGLRALVFRGKGRAFSAGADISEFGTAPSIIAARRARHDRDVWWRLLTLPIPTIARMHGFCFGAGLELPLCCDARIAADGATFALPEVTLGYIPSACGTQTLPRTVAPGIAASMILSGEPIDSEAARRWCLVDEVVAEERLDEAVWAAVKGMADDPERAMARRRAMVAS